LVVSSESVTIGVVVVVAVVVVVVVVVGVVAGGEAGGATGVVGAEGDEVELPDGATTAQLALSAIT
jgi:hypothetical protein